MNIFELHERMTGHLFLAYSNTDELDARVLQKLERVVEKHKLRLNSAPLTQESA